MKHTTSLQVEVSGNTIQSNTLLPQKSFSMYYCCSDPLFRPGLLTDLQPGMSTYPVRMDLFYEPFNVMKHYEYNEQYFLYLLEPPSFLFLNFPLAEHIKSKLALFIGFIFFFFFFVY